MNVEIAKRLYERVEMRKCERDPETGEPYEVESDEWFSLLPETELFDWPCIPFEYEGDGKKATGWEAVPDWAHNLNLMHELEEKIPGWAQWLYESKLALVVSKGSNVRPSPWNVIRATAAQRAEAWIMTWDEIQASSERNQAGAE